MKNEIIPPLIVVLLIQDEHQICRRSQGLTARTIRCSGLC